MDIQHIIDKEIISTGFQIPPFLFSNNREKTFDAKLNLEAEYNRSLDAITNAQTGEQTAFSSIQQHDYNGMPHQHPDGALAALSDLQDNCIAYSNVILVPTITADTNQLGQIDATIALESDESQLPCGDANDAQPFKYILSSDLNTLIQATDTEAAILNEVDGNGFIEQNPHFVANSDINNSLEMNGMPAIHPHLQCIEPINQNQIAIQMAADEAGILVQDENGQLYRQMPNIYVDEAGMCSTQLLPVISQQPGIENGFVEQGIHPMTIRYHRQSEHDAAFPIPVNFVETSDSAEAIPIDSKPIDNMEMQQLEFIFNSYKHSEQINDVIQQNQHQLNSNQIDPNQIASNQYGIETNSGFQDQLNSMQTLLDAVDDITAREKQFRSYLNTSDTVPDNSLDFYTTPQVAVAQPVEACCTETHTSPERSKELPKLIDHLRNDLFKDGCDSDEYVDINEMEFIEKQNESGQQEKNILMRRSSRRKSTKRKDDELLVVDKFVPSRALATLPTSYLYFETDNETLQQTVFAKRGIPMEMKFGPFVGDAKSMSKQELKKYRNDDPNYPLLFLSHGSILDVSNENTSNWMRFVRLATKHSEQNLQLCEINSQLFFKCCKGIETTQELRVGYSKHYAKKYHLNVLLPEKLKKPNKFACNICDEKCASEELLQAHLNEHNVKVAQTNRSSPLKTAESISPSKFKEGLNTGAIRKRQLAQSKNSRASGPIVRYACCYCTKVFSNFQSYKKHTNIIHSVDIEQKRVTIEAQHKRFTIADSTKKTESTEDSQGESELSETNHLFVCQTCQLQFMTAKKLEKHRKVGCSQRKSIAGQCHICLKHIQTPSALNMHIRSHFLARTADQKLKEQPHADETDFEVESNATQNDGFYKCPFCPESHHSSKMFKDHVKCHMVDGVFVCPHCPTKFAAYMSIRKHIRLNHSTVRFVCEECGMNFKSKYKLKEHTLKHSDFREFSCAYCEKEFKRKDKLRTHMLKRHQTETSKRKTISQNQIKTDVTKTVADPDSLNNRPLKSTKEKNTQNELLTSAVPLNELIKSESLSADLANQENELLESNPPQELNFDQSNQQYFEITEVVETENASTRQSFKPKVSPKDYERFIYKCNYCLLGFKRRGMLVNHMVKRHKDISISTIHELNLPILKTERCFYCQYCSKVYKSSTKRKAHILKNHPGQKLPESTRYKDECLNEPHPSFSENIGSITIQPHQCMWCPKQYASRSRLLQHKRQEHSKEIEESFRQKQNEYYKDLNMIMDSHENNAQASEVHDNQIDEYSLNINGMHDSEAHSIHRFHHIGYEPENKLLELSSAALEASMRDDYSFLSDSDVNTQIIHHPDINGSTVGVNFKMVGDEFDDGQENSNCDLNNLPQLFEEIECMTLKSSEHGAYRHFDGKN